MRWRAEAYTTNEGEPAAIRFDGQAFYDRHLKPFVEKHGERNGPIVVAR